MTTVTIRNDALTVSIDTTGAELASIRTADGSEWLWQGDAKWWAGRAPILFPVIGRNFEEGVSVGGRRFPMPPHGFVRAADFAVIDEAPGAVTLRVSDSGATRTSFPFAFTLDLVFALDGNTLVNSAAITNTGADDMPVSFGFHPAFVWPLPGAPGEAVHTVTLGNKEEPPTYRLGAGNLLVMAPEPSVFAAGTFVPRAADFERDAVIIAGLESRAVSFGVAGGPSVDVGFENLTSLGIWQKPGAPYLCLEPWQGLPAALGEGDALEKRPGTVWVQPGAARTFTMTIAPRPRA